MMFVPLQPFAIPLTAVPGVIVGPAEAVSATGSDAALTGVSYALAPADAAQGHSTNPAAVGWTGALAPAEALHALGSDAARIVRALTPTTGAGRVTVVRGEARTTGVPLS